MPGYEMTGWQGILAPAGTPGAIIARLGGAIATFMRAPEVRARFIGIGADPVGSTPQEFMVFRQAEFAKLARLAAKAGIRAE